MRTSVDFPASTITAYRVQRFGRAAGMLAACLQMPTVGWIVKVTAGVLTAW